MGFDPDFEKGWAEGVEDARRVVPIQDPMAMRDRVKDGGAYGGSDYVHAAAWRDGYHLGFSAARGHRWGAGGLELSTAVATHPV